MTVRDIVVLSAVRTPIGRFGGALKDVHPAALGATATRAAVERAGLPADMIDEVVFGHARQAGAGPNPARQVVRRAGLGDHVPGLTINRACASGMQAIISGAQSLLLGEAGAVVAGGMESMSRTPYLVEAADARWGHRLGHFPLVDGMYRDGFFCPLSELLMGETAEVLAASYGITREASDRFALESQRKAAAAVAHGRFVDELEPVRVETSRGVVEVDADEQPRAETTLESLAALPPVFTREDGTPGIITAGSASGITDGAAAVVLASTSRARALGCRPIARLLGWATVGVDPRTMGIGPVPAVRRLLATTGDTLDTFSLVEINEAFAPQVLAVLRDLPIPVDRLNVNGGAIALGHPIGCTGARIVVTLLHEMRRRRARKGLATLCVSGGMGTALALELLD